MTKPISIKRGRKIGPGYTVAAVVIEDPGIKVGDWQYKIACNRCGHERQVARAIMLQYDRHRGKTFTGCRTCIGEQKHLPKKPPEPEDAPKGVHLACLEVGKYLDRASRMAWRALCDTN